MKKVFLAFIALGLLTVSCKKKENDIAPPVVKKSYITLDLKGLDELGSDFVYEGWLIVGGAPVSTGTFTSVKFPQKINVDKAVLDKATKFVLSIEPKNDTDPKPSTTKILAGDFSGKSASVSVSGVVGDFNDATGQYILATPTDGANTNEKSGIWFLKKGTPATAGLYLPTLGSGWKYEGWVVVNGIPVSTGKFTDLSATDESDMFSGSMALPFPNGDKGFFPGEDFFKNAPNGLTFPIDLSGAKTVISVEPSPDNSAKPFTLKPLIHAIPNADAGTEFNMVKNLNSLPTGTVTRY